MRLLVCLVLSGCFLQPTVFEGARNIRQPEAAPPPDDPVGCVTRERTGHRSSTWWLGPKRVSLDDVDRVTSSGVC